MQSVDSLHPIRAYRATKGLTIEVMAAKLAVSSASLSRIESGKQWPSEAFLALLAEETKSAVTANDLVEWRAKGAAAAGSVR